MALIPPFFIDCVVAIGRLPQEDGQPDWFATGFFYGFHVEEERYRTYLVSNRHVFDGLKEVCLRFNPKSAQPAHVLNLRLIDDNGAPTWIASPDPEVDVAVVPVVFQTLLDADFQVNLFRSDRHVAPIATLVDLGVSEGDYVYVLGFPMGDVGGHRTVVIARGGTIARIRDTLEDSSRTFLVDASVFPGNSGGPVVSRPEFNYIEGTKSQDRAYLIGIVRSYVTYQDVAYSLQTKRPRVIFEENSDLAQVHPVDCIVEAVSEHLAKLERSAERRGEISDAGEVVQREDDGA